MDYEALFRASDTVRPASEAHRDGRPILARDAAGHIDLIRWRKHPDLEPGEEPYWATFSTDEIFDMVDWTASPLTDDELMKVIG